MTDPQLPQEQQPLPEEGPPLREELNSLNSRIRMVEERLSDMRKRFHLIEENLLAYHKKNLKDTKDTQQQLYDVKRSIKQSEGKILLLLKELQLSASKQEVETLKKYLELWNPLKFITEETLTKRLREAFEEAGITKEERSTPFTRGNV